MAIIQRMNAASEKLAIDPKGVDALRRAVRADADAGARAVAQQFEALLVQQMLSSMRQANQGFGGEGGGASGLFRSMQDQQFANLTAMKGGAGLADAIVRQINAQRSAATARLSASPVADATGASREDKKVQPANVVSVNLPAKPAASPAVAAGGFVDKLLGAAENASATLGVAPRVLLAQAALETGWGKRSIRNGDGSDSHNLFGIKAGKSWTGKTVDVTTTGLVDGKAQKRVEKFRSYDSYSAAFSDYASLIKRRYGDALGLGNDAAGFGQALQAGGYATDPQYASKIAKVAERVTAKLAARQSTSSLTA